MHMQSRQQAVPHRSPSAYPHSHPSSHTSANGGGKGRSPPPLRSKTHLSTPKRYSGSGGCRPLHAHRQTCFPLFLDARYQSYFMRQTPFESKITIALCCFPRLGEGKWSAVRWELQGNQVFVSCRLGLSPGRQIGGEVVPRVFFGGCAVIHTAVPHLPLPATHAETPTHPHAVSSSLLLPSFLGSTPHLPPSSCSLLPLRFCFPSVSLLAPLSLLTTQFLLPFPLQLSWVAAHRPLPLAIGTRAGWGAD